MLVAKRIAPQSGSRGPHAKDRGSHLLSIGPGYRRGLERSPWVELGCASSVALAPSLHLERRSSESTMNWTADIEHRTWVLRVGLLLLFVAMIGIADVFTGERGNLSSEVPGTQARVSRVVDGDTIIVALDGEDYRVRYIGIDAPETVRPDWPVEPFGPEASEFNKQLVEGKTVWLERDVTETDQFGRLLRYVWLEDGRLVNAVLVEEGCARAVTLPPDVKHAADVVRLQREAQANERGLWARR